jgi:RNA polymerase sigma-70 factor (sigma-E family)
MYVTKGGDGDRDQFSAFVERRYGALTRLGWALTGDQQRGEDLAQATLVRMWTRWKRLSATDDPWRYAQRVAISQAATWRRRRWHDESATADTPDTTQTDSAETVIGSVQMTRWLAGLPARQRAVVVLRFLVDQSVEDVAEILNCSQGTIKSQTAKARRTLRALIEAEQREEQPS